MCPLCHVSISLKMLCNDRRWSDLRRDQARLEMVPGVCVCVCVCVYVKATHTAIRLGVMAESPNR